MIRYPNFARKPCYNSLSGVGSSQVMQNPAFDMLYAFDERDTEKLSETGIYQDKACHANY
jgi:hypothetical protein